MCDAFQLMDVLFKHSTTLNSMIKRMQRDAYWTHFHNGINKIYNNWLDGIQTFDGE